jgi:hypothetical protein
MKFKFVILYFLFVCVIVHINAQNTQLFRSNESLYSKSNCFQIPIIWIDTINVQHITISVFPKYEDSIRNVIDNYNCIVIENSNIFANILPYYSSLRYQIPIIYMGGNSPECDNFPLHIHIYHLSETEQNKYIEELIRLAKIKNK